MQVFPQNLLRNLKMKENKKILFIGSFLSDKKGTKGVSESLKENLLIQDTNYCY